MGGNQMKFKDCEDWLEAHVRQGIQPVGVEFNNVSDIALPSRLGHGCMAWPEGWLDSEKRYWRSMMEMPGSYLQEFATEIVMPDWYKSYLRSRRKPLLKRMVRRLTGAT